MWEPRAVEEGRETRVSWLAAEVWLEILAEIAGAGELGRGRLSQRSDLRGTNDENVRDALPVSPGTQ